MSRRQNAGRNHNIKIANKFFATLAIAYANDSNNQNCIHDKIKSSLYLESVCLSENVGFPSSMQILNQLYTIKNICVVFHGLETWSLILMVELKLVC